MTMIAVELNGEDMRRAAAGMLECLSKCRCLEKFDELQATLIHGYVLGVMMSASGWQLPDGLESTLPTVVIGYRDADRCAAEMNRQLEGN